MIVKNIPVSRINPAPYNPRKDLKPSDKEYAKLKKSIETFGYVDPIIWNEATGNLVGGHQRFKILMEDNPKEVMASVVNLDEVREKALNIALNKVSGAWDDVLLADLLRDLEDSGADLELTGFEQKELDKLYAKVEKIREEEKPEVEFTAELHESHNYVVLIFDNDIDWLNAKEVFGLKAVTDRMHGVTMKRVTAKGLGHVVMGEPFLRRLAGVQSPGNQ